MLKGRRVDEWRMFVHITSKATLYRVLGGCELSPNVLFYVIRRLFTLPETIGPKLKDASEKACKFLIKFHKLYFLTWLTSGTGRRSNSFAYISTVFST